MSEKRSRKPGFCVTAVVVILTGLTLLAVGIGVPWAHRNALYDDAIERSQDLLQRYQRLVDSLPLLQSKLDALKADKSAADYYLDAADAAEGGIVLQRRMEQFAAATNTELNSIQIVPGKAELSVSEVVVRLRMRTDIESLGGLLYKIDSSRPVLIISRLNIRSLARGRGQEQLDGVLDVNLDVSAYVKTGAE